MALPLLSDHLTFAIWQVLSWGEGVRAGRGTALPRPGKRGEEALGPNEEQREAGELGREGPGDHSQQFLGW